MLEEISPECPTLYDYAYVNNFDNEDNPILLQFPAGKGIKFKRDMSNSIQFLQENIPQVLESEIFTQQKKKMIASFGQSQQNLLNEFEKKLRKDNFALGQVKVGEVARPEIMALIEDQPVFVQQLDELVLAKKVTKRKAQNITKKYATYQEELQQVFRKSLQLNQDFKQQLKQLETDEVTHIINATFDHIKSSYKIEKVKLYIKMLLQIFLKTLMCLKDKYLQENKRKKEFILII
jgi:SpoVK/Ycf46/Vps4 family AAA+-type ATPase